MKVSIALTLLLGAWSISAAGSAPVTLACEHPQVAIISIADVQGHRVCDSTLLIVRDDRGPGAVVLPPPGGSTTYSATSEKGEVPDFTVSRDVEGRVTRTNSTARNGPLGEAQATTPVKCSSHSFAAVGDRWTSTVRWYYKTPSWGGQARVSAGLSAMANGVSACGANVANSASHSYAGTTTTPANISGSVCLGSDGKNVIDAGSLPSGVLASTCRYSQAGVIVSADIRFSTNIAWYTGGSTACALANTYDLQGLAAHEAGHLFGLDHVAQSTGQVMKPSSTTCETQQRQLGSGDLAGMKYLYP